MHWSQEDLDRIRKRDPAAFEKLYAAYKDKIFQYIYIKSKKNMEITEDIMSDTFYSAMQSAPKLKNANNLFSWLLEIAKRRYCDYFRKHFKEKNQRAELPGDINDRNTPNGALIEKERLLLIQLAMEALNPLYREALELKYRQKKSQEEMADILEKSVFAIESILYRARNMLKKKLKAFLEE